MLKYCVEAEAEADARDKAAEQRLASDTERRMVCLKDEAGNSMREQRRKLEHEAREFEDNTRANSTDYLSSRVKKKGAGGISESSRGYEGTLGEAALAEEAYDKKRGH